MADADNGIENGLYLYLRDEYSRTNMSEVLDGTDKDPLRRWIFMFEMNLIFSLNEKGDP